MKKRIQLTINEDLLAKAEQLAKARCCDSISELVTDLLKEEDSKQAAQNLPGKTTYPPHRSRAVSMNDAPNPKDKKLNSAVAEVAQEALGVVGNYAKRAEAKTTARKHRPPSNVAQVTKSKPSGTNQDQD